MYKGKKVLVTGSSGMIGKELVKQLEELGANIKKVDKKLMDEMDLTDFNCCLDVCQDMDYVFHLAGIKGNPKMTQERPVDFIGPMLQFDTNMILAAQKCNVKRFLYTSSIAVENIKTDIFPAWAKMTGETLIEAMRIQYPKGTDFCIVRPGNVFGRYDNPNREGCMAITNLIKAALKDEELVVWGDGYQERDFISAKEVAKCMIETMENMPEKVVKCGRGHGIKIRDVAAIIINHDNPKIKATKIKFDETKPSGEKKRVLDTDWSPATFFPDELKEMIEYACNNWEIK